MTAGTATVTTKGQVTVPKSIRELLGLRSGDVLIFEAAGEAIKLRKASRGGLYEFFRDNPLPGPSMLKTLKKIRDEWD